MMSLPSPSSSESNASCEYIETLCDIFTITSQLPQPTLNWAHYITFITTYIATKDTVSIRSNGYTFPFVGRILSVSPCGKIISLITVHPTAIALDILDGDPVFFLQLYAQKLHDIPIQWQNSWRHLEQQVLKATTGLSQVAITNALVWCCVSQIDDIVFFPHTEEYIYHTYGPMYGRISH